MNGSASLELLAQHWLPVPGAQLKGGQVEAVKLPERTHKQVSRTPWGVSRGYGFVPVALVARAAGPRSRVWLR